MTLPDRRHMLRILEIVFNHAYYFVNRIGERCYVELYALFNRNSTRLKNGGSHHSQNSFIENENIGNSSQRLKSISESVCCSSRLVHNSVLNSFKFLDCVVNGFVQ